MAMVDAMPVPDSRQKVDELFLFWLSEPSTQEMLRNELTKVCRYGNPDLTADGADSSILGDLVHHPGLTTNIQRSKSPNYRTPSPQLHLSNSPKSPRAKRRSKSPRRNLKYGLGGGSSSDASHTVEKSAINGGPGVFDDVDYFPSALVSPTLPSEPPSSNKAENVGAPGTVPTKGRKASQAATRTAGGLKLERQNVIPQFFFPNGQLGDTKQSIDAQLKAATKVFQEHQNGEMLLGDFHLVVKAMKLPLYWKAPLFLACVGEQTTPTATPTVTLPLLKKTWQRITRHCHDDAARFVKLLVGGDGGRNHLKEADFEPLIQDIVDTHPGLAFLATAPEFHARYVETVISRIFYVVDRSWNNRITASDLRRSNFLQVLKTLEDEEDINVVTDYFSYEHFYVIYCKFWELDTDHDLLIDAQDLSRHADHSLTPRVIERIMSGVVTRDRTTPAGKLSYRDFIWFLISEEDKTTQRSIEYWFRCLDIDGDGVLSLYELELFYDEVLQRLRELSIECLSVENTVCQVLDMINPREKSVISLCDLKTCKLTPIFFNTFINVEKYLEYEQRDPVTTAKDDSETPITDWNRYAAEQYEILLAEEACENETSSVDDEQTTGDSDLGEDEREMLALL